jgi:excisionase family DNA binding protein
VPKTKKTLDVDPRFSSIQLLTVGQVAGILGLGQRTVWRMAGELNPVRIGAKAVRFRLSDIERFVKERKPL